MEQLTLKETLGLSWSFHKIWNESVQKPQRQIKPRNRIWASELGGSYIDRYLKMTGVEMTNPPNARSLRKFEAGNIWESITGYVLKRAGLLIDSQKWLPYQYDDLLPVTGKLDFLAGGKPDYDKASHVIKNELSWLPDFISRVTLNIVEDFKQRYPNGLKEIVLEIKSCSAFMFEIYEKNDTASPHHQLQSFHYLKALRASEAHIVYICRDDARILELGVFNPSYVEDMYRKDIAKMTYYYDSGEEPPKEKEIVFNEEFKKFSANWKVGYSGYLKKLYGFENQKEFDDKVKPTVDRWNRVLGRIREEKDMTDKNKDVITEIESAGFDVNFIESIIKENKETAYDLR